MSQLLVRDLTAETIQRLKDRARRHGRSLQGEVKVILQAATAFSPDEARLVAEGWREQLAGQNQSDSAELVREDRGR